MRALARKLFTEATGNVLSDALARRVARTRLRILAYHDVPNAAAFSAQMGHLARHYQPVSAGDVADAVAGRAKLPTNAVWVTFDDGYPGVLERGLPVLDRHGIRATMFVCPGVIDTEEPFWWQEARAALRAGVTLTFEGRQWSDESLVARLKHRPDEMRRVVVAELARRAQRHSGTRLRAPQLSSRAIEQWCRAGQDVGNHTWDHPCLGRCSPSEQAAQIERAHAWLQERAPGYRPLFAYPNGDWAAAAEAALVRTGHELAVLFDHRLATVEQSGLRLSRLRVSADADLARFRSVLSGVHAGVFALAGRAPRAENGERQTMAAHT